MGARAGLPDAFIAASADGYPTLKQTVIDPASRVALEAAVAHRSVRVLCRRATVAEVRRAEAAEQLRDAEGGTDYAYLHGRIVNARARGVEARRLDQAQARLKTLQPDAATKEELVEALTWARVTADPSHATGDECKRVCCARPGCGVGAPLDGQRLEFETSAAELALEGVKTGDVPKDRWLFERIADAAVAAANDGGVWRSGGKFILSALSRNQSPVALRRFLASLGQKECAEGIDALIAWTGSAYEHKVSAVQINVHIDATPSAHSATSTAWSSATWRGATARAPSAQHRDGVPLPRIDAPRLVEAEVDDYSRKAKCCERCEGYSCSHWLRSGSLALTRCGTARTTTASRSTRATPTRPAPAARASRSRCSARRRRPIPSASA